MKKKLFKVILGLFLLCGIVFIPLELVFANENGFTGSKNESEVDKNDKNIILLDSLLEKSASSRKSEETVLPTPCPSQISVEAETEVYEPRFTTLASYTEFTYEDDTRYYYYGGVAVGAAYKKCTVWHYTDGKVHLRSRSFERAGIDGFTVSYKHGNIVNTDGSKSYTQGDQVTYKNSSGTVKTSYAYEFYVKPNDPTFSYVRLTELRSFD